MNHSTARQTIRDRITALTPASTYVSASSTVSFKLVATWNESRTPLLPEIAPSPIAALAFWVDNREIGFTETRSGHDPVFVTAPVRVRFTYPMRENGPPADDWDRATLAAEHLRDHLLDPTWAESESDGGLCLQLSPRYPHACRPVGDGTWLLWELPFLIQYERTT